MPNPNEPLTVTMTFAEWTNLAPHLAKLPFEAVALLMFKLQEQTQAAAAAEVRAVVAAAANGGGDPAHVSD